MGKTKHMDFSYKHPVGSGYNQNGGGSKDQESGEEVVDVKEKDTTNTTTTKYGWIKKRKPIDEIDNDEDDWNTTAPSPQKKYKPLPLVNSNSIKRNSACSKELEAVNREYEKELRELEQWKQIEIKRIIEKYRNYDDNNNRNSIVALDYYGSDKSEGGTNLEGKPADIKKNNTIYYHYSRNQFNVPDGKTACTSISLVCCYNYLVVGCNLPMKKYNWDMIVIHGAKVWSHYKSVPDKIVKNYHYIQELLEMKELESVNNNIELEKEIGGHLDDNRNIEFEKAVECQSSSSDSDTEDDSKDLIDQIENGTPFPEKAFYTIQEAIELMCSYDCRIAASMTIRGSTFTLMCDMTPPPPKYDHFKKVKTREEEVDECMEFLRDDYLSDTIFWLFDSHGGRKERLSNLIRFKGVSSIIDYMKTTYPTTNEGNRKSLEDSHVNQYSMTIFRRKKAAAATKFNNKNMIRV